MSKPLNDNNIGDNPVDDTQNNITDVSEDTKETSILSLFEGTELTEETQEKIKTLFEAAVSLRVKEEVDAIATELDEKFKEEIAVQTEKLHEELEAKTSSYLEVMAESWIKDNKVELESAIKVQMFESFFAGLKVLFEEHNISMPEEKFDVVESLEQKIEALQSQLNESMEARAELLSEMKEIKKEQLIKESTEGLTAIDAEKLTNLAKDISFEDEAKFSSKLNIIKENFFANASHSSEVKAVVTDAPVLISEEVKQPEEEKVELPSDVQGFLNALKTIK